MIKLHKSKKKYLFIITIIIFISIIFLNYNNIFLYLKSITTGYNIKTIKVFNDNNIEKQITRYSETLDEAIKQDKFNPRFLDIYYNINYQDLDNFIDLVNNLATIGYNASDINAIFANINPSNINIIINNTYDPYLGEYIKLDYFNEEKLDRYIKFSNNQEKLNYSIFFDNNTTFNALDIVTLVNANLDKEYYSNDLILTTEESNKTDAIVNKYYQLEEDFEPNNLTAIDSKYARNDSQLLQKEATEAFNQMCRDAKLENISLYSGSAYRSYEYQNTIYNDYIKKDGLTTAETYSARPGYSEHQLGLAVDIMNGNWSYVSKDNIEYSWLIANSYKYGFILRYPENKEYITGYMFEPWHYRYLGKELATRVYNSGLTYDEYVARNLN